MKNRKPLERAIVVSLDLRSSSWIVDELESDNNLVRLGGFLGKLKQFLRDELKDIRGVKFTPYKFLGDSWLLLFPPATSGRDLLVGLRDFCAVYDQEFETLRPHLGEHVPAKQGIAFGVDAGPLLPTTIFGNQEYLGRCINIATRLQSHAKDAEGRFTLFASASAYDEHFADAGFGESRTRRDLRGFRNGANFDCVQVHLA